MMQPVSGNTSPLPVARRSGNGSHRLREPEEAPARNPPRRSGPPRVINTLDLVHGIREARDCGYAVRLWPWSRTTAFRRIREVMADADVEGPQARFRSYCCTDGGSAQLAAAAARARRHDHDRCLR